MYERPATDCTSTAADNVVHRAVFLAGFFAGSGDCECVRSNSSLAARIIASARTKLPSCFLAILAGCPHHRDRARTELRIPVAVFEPQLELTNQMIGVASLRIDFRIARDRSGSRRIAAGIPVAPALVLP